MHDHAARQDICSHGSISAVVCNYTKTIRGSKGRAEQGQRLSAFRECLVYSETNDHVGCH